MRFSSGSKGNDVEFMYLPLVAASGKRSLKRNLQGLHIVLPKRVNRLAVAVSQPSGLGHFNAVARAAVHYSYKWGLRHSF